MLEKLSNLLGEITNPDHRVTPPLEPLQQFFIGRHQQSPNILG
jgi:hypothetical protein